MGSHGPQFDEFTAQSGEHRGGALFDEHPGGPSANAGTKSVTQTYRDVTANGQGHGKLWDEFGWRQMPALHGRHFDSDFTQPAMGDANGHGTWQDVFSGGNAQVRADVNGIAAVEAVVIECHADHAVLELRRPRHADGGGRVEVNLNQIREWRHATQQGQASETRKPTASPGNTPARDKPSTAEAPSAHNATAHGGGRELLDTAPATGSVITTVKTLRELAGVDVAKGAPTECKCSAVMPAAARDKVNGLHDHACPMYDPQGDDRPDKPAKPVGKSIDDSLVELRKIAGLEA